MNIIFQLIIGLIGLGVVGVACFGGIFLLHELDMIIRRMFRGR
jgi:hypothetical protein